MKFGILGTARISQRVAPAIKSSHITRLIGVASRELSRAEQAAKEFGAAKSFGSYEELLASDEIDAVYIPLPNSLHAEWSVKAAEAGKHVLCEKPIATNSTEAEMVMKACEQHEVLLMEAFMYRHHPQHAKVKEIISSGRIGDPRIVNARFTFYLEPSENIRWKQNLSGGALMDIGCYCINVARLIFGAEPQSAKAIRRYDDKRKVDITTLGLLEFPENRFASFTGSLLMSRANRYEVIGTKGSIEVPTAFVPGKADVVLTIRDGSGIQEIILPGVDQYGLEVEHFSRCILEGTALRNPAENGLANMRAIDMVKEVF